METTPSKLLLTQVLAYILLFPLVANSQTASDKQQGSASVKSTVSKAEKKAPLADATRVSTDAAVHQAAKQINQGKTETDSSDGSSETDVTEFHAATPADEGAKNPVVVKSGDAKKSPLRDVHGTVYGAAAPGAPGNRRAGTAVGASSKSGKSSVYVESDSSRAASPSPR